MHPRFVILLLLVGALAGAVGGYAFGTRKLRAVQADLDKLTTTLDAQKTAYDATVARMEQRVRDADAQHQAEQKRIHEQADAHRSRLETLNRDAGLRLTEAQARIAAITAERSQLTRLRAQAGPDRQPELAQRDTRLAADQLDAQRRAAGLACLAERVPAEQLDVLRQLANR